MRSHAFLLCAIVLLSCDSATSVDDGLSPDDVASLTIIRNGAPADTLDSLASFGTIGLDIEARNSADEVLDKSAYRVEWGTTNPSIVNVRTEATGVFADVRHDGIARIIARVGNVRDTLALSVKQVAVFIRIEQDTIVVPVSGATRVDGGSSAGYETMRFTSFRIDANGNPASSPNNPITFFLLDSTVRVTPEGLGDTAQIVGLEPGTARFFGSYGMFARLVVSHVVDRFAVVRITKRPNGGVLILPDTARIPAGAAVIFQNETDVTVNIKGDPAPLGAVWRVGPIPPTGREGQLFTQPGTFLYAYGGATHAIIVSP